MPREAIYAVSADPWTKGHTDIVRRALQIFDHVIVAIGVNPKKKYSFPLDMRKKMAQYSLVDFMDRIEVESFEGLLVDYAYMRGIKTLIRGIRDDIDFNFEKSMFQVNISQKGIDEIFLFPSPQYEHISSSAVRELFRNQGNIVEYVDLRVKQSMEVQLSNLRLVGFTGLVGAGKTFMANKLCDMGSALYDMDFHNIELDVIGKNLLSKDSRPFAVDMRHNLVNTWEDTSLVVDPKDPNYFIDVKKLSRKIFTFPNALMTYNFISRDPILFELNQQLRNKTGVAFINSALLIEAKLTPLCNNNVVFVKAPEDFRMENLKSRGYTGEELDGRMNGQMSGKGKEETFMKLIEEEWGQLLYLNNSPNIKDRDLAHLLEQIMNLTGCV